ncbi:M4 family metallopeptidase [Streptomyces sp. NPDC049577]|uniref:M4 family metallopeptidase n=1 Tax=Streptomyces sp. NPDC049577 TaxID=3155153 RepID=UPI003421ED55
MTANVLDGTLELHPSAVQPTSGEADMARLWSSLAVAAGLLASLVLPGTPHAAAATPAEPATGVGCGTRVDRIPLDTRYNPQTHRYELVDTRRGGHRTSDLQGGTWGQGTLVTDVDNVWCDGGRQAAAVDAHYLHAVVWDYFLGVHGRKGVRDDGQGGCSLVHYGRDSAAVFWDGRCLTYGDGMYGGPSVLRIDTAAHEWAHGVTEATAALGYSGESGALNEATGDIFATAVEFFARNPADPGDYLIGEEPDINGNGTPLRYLDRPSRDGRSKDYWYPGIGGTDPHLSSGVANHFFYLLAEGSGAKMIDGMRYDSPTYDGKPVAGIGRTAAERIWYRALTAHMTPTTDYRAARTATLTAASDLYGQDSAQYRAVDAAWAAVNVR